MTFAEILSQLMDERKLTIAETSRLTNVPDATLRSIIRRNSESVALDVAFKIALGFNVSLSYLNGNDNDLPKTVLAKPHFTDEEKEHMLKFRKLDNHGKKIVNIILDEEYYRTIDKDDFSTQTEEPEGENVIELNFSEQPSSAGTGYWLDEEQMIKKKIILNRDTAKADLCIPVSGDSMTPLYHDGDILLVRKQPAVDIGEIGIFTIDGAGYVKKFGIGQLESLNPEYEPIPINEDTDLICNGKVLGILNRDWIVD